MDDKHIEELLRNTLQATPPEGMWERTLTLARQQRARGRIFGTSQWKAAFVALSVAVIAFTSFSECRREQRIAALTVGSSAGVNRSLHGPSFWEMRREMCKMLARTPEVRSPVYHRKGENPL
jgi:hypothetical protein